MNKTGILGGTFDPVHNGHLAIAGEALKKVDLDKVIFVPARNQPLKQGHNTAPVEQRMKMLELALAGNQRYVISDIEIMRPAPSYTVDTLTLIQRQLGKSVQLYFIMGWDSLTEIGGWKEPGKILEMCTLVAVTRSTVARPDLKAIQMKIPGIESKTILLEMPPVDISSTEIRSMVEQGLPIDGLVPDAVGDYIKQNGLYSRH